MRWLATLALLAIAVFAPEAAKAQNRCYNCHLAQQREEDADHLRDWRDSVHDRAGVGCEDCHGGDAGTLVQLRAHRGVLHSLLRKSPTHWKNLPSTCGGCHETLFAAAQRSAHWALFSEGERRAPSCATCHGPLAVAGLGSGGLSGQCSTCHEADSEVGRQMGRRSYLARIREVRAVVQRVGRRVLQIRDPGVRHDAGAVYFDGQQTWEEAMEEAHAFELTEMLESLDRAEDRLLERRIDCSSSSRRSLK